MRRQLVGNGEFGLEADQRQRSNAIAGPSQHHGMNGPDRTFESEVNAALRLNRTGRSCIAQHFHRLNDRMADLSAVRCKRPNDRSSEAIPRRIGYEM